MVKGSEQDTEFFLLCGILSLNDLENLGRIFIHLA